jgi:general nucleoside transport system permease protein
MKFSALRYSVTMILLAVCVVGVVMCGIAAVLACFGFGFWPILSTWVAGAVGSPHRLAMSLQEATPLLMTGLAAAVAFRSGVWNIGAEGQFIIGALIMVGACTLLPSTIPAWLVLGLGFMCALSASAVWGLLATGLEYRRGVPMVLSTILLNFIAFAGVGLVVEEFLSDPTTTAPQTSVIASAYRLPVLMTHTKWHVGFIVALILCVVFFIVWRRTAFGFVTRVVGINPRAAQENGMSVGFTHLCVMGISAGIAGLGGALHVAGVTYMLNSSPMSYGYAGIAVAMVGRLHPLGIILAAIFLGMLSSGARHVERQLGVAHDVGDIVHGVAVLAVVIVLGFMLQRNQRARQGIHA